MKKFQIPNFKFQRGTNSHWKLQPFGEGGFALVELLLVLGIAGILLSITTINLAKVQRSTNLSTVTETVTADVKNQQTKAMNGSSETGISGDSYGVAFNGTNTYVLFRGASKTSNPATNVSISVDGVTITSSPTSIVFAQRSGEIPATATITIANTAGETKTVTVNTYGQIQ